MSILKLLSKNRGCCASLEEVSKHTGFSLPLISYHINGTLKSQGLKDMEIIKTEEEGNKTRIKLTPLGRMFMKGYLV